MASISSNTASTYTVFITGVNSGLGFGICCRLIVEFLHLRPQSQKLHIITTTRDRKKADETISRLDAHLQSFLRKADKKTPGISKLLEPRVSFQAELLDLSKLQTIRQLAEKLLRERRRIDVLIHNAGVHGLTGDLKYKEILVQAVQDPVYLTTYPTFAHGRVNWRIDPQLKASDNDKNATEEPVLGAVFTANVFGPYMLTHQLMPLLNGDGDRPPGRVVYVGSVNAFPFAFKTEDFQGLNTPHAYESSKRLLDILLLTYGLPAVRPWTDRWCGIQFANTSQSRANTSSATSSLPSKSSTIQPKIYIAHPGIVQTNIVPLNWLIQILLRLTMLFYRTILGNMWQTAYPYTAAVSMVWLALSSQTMLDAMEEDEGRGKWGSAVDRWGEERCERTEVEGWGIGGEVVVGEGGKKRTGSWRGLNVTTLEVREEFEALGRDAWREMEGLRVEWERRLGWS